MLLQVFPVASSLPLVKGFSTPKCLHFDVWGKQHPVMSFSNSACTLQVAF